MRFRIRIQTKPHDVWLRWTFSTFDKAKDIATQYKITPNIRIIHIYWGDDEIWCWTPERGEQTMGKFAQAVASRGTGSYINAQLKKALAENVVPFTIEAVSGPTERTFTNGKKVQKQDLYDLKVSFGGSGFNVLQRDYGVNETMTLSFAAGYEGRDDTIEAIREDIANGEIVRAVVTYDPEIGQQGWYDLAPAD